MAEPQQQIEPLTDEEVVALAGDPSMYAKFTSEERRRASRLTAVPHMGAPSEKDPVTLGDWLDNPKAAMSRAGDLLGKDLRDPKLWAGLAASFIVPKVIGPTVRGAMKVGSAAMDINPDLVGMASPRLGNAMRVQQQARAAMASKAPAEAPAAEPSQPVAPSFESPLDLTRRLKAENQAKHAGATSPVESASGGTPPPASPQSSPVPATAPKGKSPQQTLNEEALARRRSEYQAKAVTAPAEAPAAVNDDAVLYKELRGNGLTDEQAQAVMSAKGSAEELNTRLGLKTPTDAETRFPKGMRGKTPSPMPEAQPTPIVHPETLTYNGKRYDAKYAGGDAQYAASRAKGRAMREAAARKRTTDEYLDFPKVTEADAATVKAPKVELSPGHIREARRIAHELDAAPYTPTNWRNVAGDNGVTNYGETGGGRGVQGNAGGGAWDKTPASEGAKVYQDIMQVAPGTAKISRGTLQRQLEAYLAGGKMTNAVKGALEIARLRLEGKSHIPGDGRLSTPELPKSAGDVPTRLEKK